MDDKELRIDLEARLGKLINNFAGEQVDQNFIAKLWAATRDEIMFFNDEFMNFPKVVVEWIHSQFVNRMIKLTIQGEVKTFGELTTQADPPRIQAIALVDLYRMRRMFENTLLEGDIVAEIKVRLSNDGKTDKQASRGSVSTDN